MILVLAALVVGGLMWMLLGNRSRAARGDRNDALPSRADPPMPADLPVGAPIAEQMQSLGRVEACGLMKEYDGVAVVDDVSFIAEPGRVTCLLGPNGAGKTTALRMLLGLVTPSAGVATIGGNRYADIDGPVVMVGAQLEASGAHEGRTGRDHLRVMCRAAGLPLGRADDVLDAVGLARAGTRRVGGYSLGMRQRLGVAAALLGDPHVVVLDEPGNGLDPAGIHWMRDLLRALAASGRTVLVSSHQLGEVEQLADDLVVIAAGRVVASGALASVVGAHAGLEVAFLEMTAGKGEIR